PWDHGAFFRFLDETGRFMMDIIPRSQANSLPLFRFLLLQGRLFIFLALAPRIFRSGVPFASGWWSVGFPMAALAISALKYSMFVQIWPLKVVAVSLLMFVTVTIAVLFLKTLKLIISGKLLAG
ncbi:hypothetical protein J3364_21170, partial [Marinobacter sp. NFXS9]